MRNFTVVSCYIDQKRYINGLLRHRFRNTRAWTVDSIQGCEASIVDMACTRSKKNSWISPEKKRLNVATIRVQDFFIIIGDFETSMNGRSSYKLRKFIAECNQNFHYGDTTARFHCDEENGEAKIIGPQLRPKLSP